MTENPNEKSAVTKGTMAAGFSVASVWFGTHVGAGFATGNQVITYFVQYGWTAVLYPLISMGILAYVIYVIMKFARLRGLDNYADTFRELWSPYPWLSITFEIFYIIIILAAVAAAISGAALLVDDVFPFFPGGTEETASLASTIIVAVLLILLCLFGVKLIIAASTVLTIGIIVTAGLMIIIGVANRRTRSPLRSAARWSRRQGVLARRHHLLLFPVRVHPAHDRRGRHPQPEGRQEGRHLRRHHERRHAGPLRPHAPRLDA